MAPLVLRRAKRGFTMVELLVVLAIIATLIALLFPAFQQVRTQGVRSENANQMRQIGAAFLLYRGENNGEGPPDYRDQGNLGIAGWLYTNRLAVFGPLLPYLGLESGSEWPTVTPDIFISPATNPKRLSFLESPGSNTTSYWMNPDVSSGSGLRTGAIPPRRVAIMDTCWWWAPRENIDSHDLKGFHAFRIDGSMEWIAIEKTEGLPPWQWYRLDDI